MTTRQGVFAATVPTPKGWVTVTISVDQWTVEAVRLATGEVLWSHTAVDAPGRPRIKFGHLEADAAPDGSIFAVAQASCDGEENKARNDKLVTINAVGYEETAIDCTGTRGALVRWNGRGFVLFSKHGTTYTRQEIGRAPVVLPSLLDAEGFASADGWFDGVAGLAEDGSQDDPTWADRDRDRTIDGLGLMEAVHRGPLWFGQERSTVDRLVGVRQPGAHLLVHEGLGKYPKLAVSADGLEYAATWANLGGTISVALLPPFTPWTPAVVPPLSVPDFPACPHVMSIGFAWEPAPVDWCEWCVFDKDTLAQQQAKIDKARARKVPIVADWDAGDVFNWGRFDEFKARCQDVLAIPALRFYPLDGEAPAAAVERWRPEAERAARDYPGRWSYVFCAYRQIDGHGVFHIGAQDVIDLWNGGYRLGNEFRARHAEGFAWRRPDAGPVVDGVLASPDMLIAAHRMYAAVPTARQYPRQPTAPTVVVVPPVTVPPVKPKPTPKPKSRFWHDLSEAIKRWFR